MGLSKVCRVCQKNSRVPFKLKKKKEREREGGGGGDAVSVRTGFVVL